MSRLLYLAVFPMLMVCGAALAQPLAINSGEHDGFSRLVIRLPKNTGWSARDTGASARVSVDLENVVFDTTRVFNRIPKTRLAAISQDGPGQPLQLKKNCPCKLRTFLQSGTFLVIDLLDPAPSPGRALAPVTFVTQGEYRFPSFESGGETDFLSERPTLRFRAQVFRKTEKPSGKPEPPPVQIPNLLSLPNAAQTGFLKVTEARLLEQIGAAADRGVLQPDGAGNGSLLPSTEKADRSRPSEREDTPHGPDFAARAGKVPDMAHIRLKVNDKPTKVNCLDPQLVAIGGWADGRPFGDQVGELRRSLFTEFDAVEPSGVVGLARLYLYFGFGTEALSALSILGDARPDTDVLKVMAGLFDSIPQHGPNPLAGQSRCDSDVAFWSFLTDRDGAAMVSENSRGAILRTFAGLPPHLKVLLGPGLSERFLSTGDSGASEMVLRTEELSSPASGADSELARAELELDRGQSSIARQRLAKVVAGNSEKSPEALVKWVDAKLAADEHVASDVPELISAFAVEYRGSEIGDQLLRSQALALALSGDFPQSFRIIADIAAAGETGETTKTRNTVLGLLSERGEDVTFLALALNDLDRKDATRPVKVGNAMARRFIDLGFPDAAEQVLLEPVFARSQTQRRMMRAEIALDRGLPNRAMAELAGLTRDAAQWLRARAMMQKGEFAGSAEAFLNIAAPDSAARSFWLSGDLAAATSRGSGKFSTAAEIALGLKESAAARVPVGQLAQTRAILAQSEEARAGIANLLDVIASGKSAH